MNTINQKNRTPSVYRMYDKENNLLYVGVSVFFMARLENHFKHKYWIEDVVRIEIEKFKNEEDMIEAERRIIASEKPKYNIALNNKFKSRPHITERKNRQRRAFTARLNKYVEESGKSWLECACDLGICHTAISRWKNARICPSIEMLKQIEEWSDGFIIASDFDVDNFN